MESIGQVADVERLKHRKVPRGRNAESSEGDAASEDFKKAASHAPDIQDEAVVDGADCFADGKSNREGEDDDGSKGMLYSDEDEDSLESNVGSDLLTNVEGQIDSLCNTRPVLTGVEIVEDDATENVGMKNVAKLLRRKRYHDDDISQPATAPRISMSRCFRCLLPGHLARDCPNPAKQKPCASCAGYGHLQARCPKSFCFRCNGFGHVLADCHEDEAPKHGRVCVRCGKQECSASGGMDWFRVHRGCRELYSQSDLRHVRCFVCGQQGHFCCEDSPLEPAYPTCCLCGRKGHTGILDSCPDPLPPFLSAEANQAQRLREPSSRPQHARSGGYDRSGRPHDNNVGRQPRTGPMRLDTGRDGSGYHIRQNQHDSRRYLQCGRAAAEPAQLAMRAAAGDRYGPQRYGYSPADPPPGAQTSAHTESRQRRLHEAPPGQYRGHAHGDALHVAAAHPPPDVIAYGNRTVAGGRNNGGFRGQGDAHMQGGRTVMIQGAQPWQLQQHDISAQRYHPGSPGGQVQYQHTHAVQPQYVARSDATYYTSNANGQGTHRRWM